jgi:hypothetical protein
MRIKFKITPSVGVPRLELVSLQEQYTFWIFLVALKHISKGLAEAAIPRFLTSSLLGQSETRKDCPRIIYKKHNIK